MKEKEQGLFDFLMELAGRQTTVTQLFSPQLLTSIETHLGLHAPLILCFDEHNTFLSWTDTAGVWAADDRHPYVAFAPSDVVEHVVFHTSSP